MGTNDPIPANNTTWLQTIANIATFINLCKQYGIIPVICTMPPVGSGADNLAARLMHIEVVNLWIRLFARRGGARVADTHAALVDPATGYLAAAYAYGDGIHWNGKGHYAAAKVVAAAMLNTQPAPELVNCYQDTSLNTHLCISNPLMAGTIGATRPTGWQAQIAVSGSATRSVIAKPSSFKVGQAYQIQVDGTAANASVTEACPLVTGNYAVGDLLGISYRQEVEDVAGNWEATQAESSIAAPVGAFATDLRIQAGTGVGNSIGSPSYIPSPALVVPPTFLLATVPAGATAVSAWFTALATFSALQNAKLKLGQLQVFNLTRMGLAGLFA